MARQNKEYYIVLNVSAANDGYAVATGTIPAGSPTIDGNPTEGTYTFYKVIEGGTPPEGDRVTLLSAEEARLVVQSKLFNTIPTTEFIAAELAKCDTIRAEFMRAQSGIGTAAAEALLVALEPTSIALSVGSLPLAYNRFNASGVDAALIAQFNPLFWEYFYKFPRDLSS